jgi:hypothetical protein
MTVAILVICNLPIFWTGSEFVTLGYNKKALVNDGWGEILVTGSMCFLSSLLN